MRATRAIISVSSVISTVLAVNGATFTAYDDGLCQGNVQDETYWTAAQGYHNIVLTPAGFGAVSINVVPDEGSNIAVNYYGGQDATEFESTKYGGGCITESAYIVSYEFESAANARLAKKGVNGTQAMPTWRSRARALQGPNAEIIERTNTDRSPSTFQSRRRSLHSGNNFRNQKRINSGSMNLGEYQCQYSDSTGSCAATYNEMGGAMDGVEANNPGGWQYNSNLGNGDPITAQGNIAGSYMFLEADYYFPSGTGGDAASDTQLLSTADQAFMQLYGEGAFGGIDIYLFENNVEVLSASYTVMN